MIGEGAGLGSEGKSKMKSRLPAHLQDPQIQNPLSKGRLKRARATSQVLNVADSSDVFQKYG